MKTTRISSNLFEIIVLLRLVRDKLEQEKHAQPAASTQSRLCSDGADDVSNVLASLEEKFGVIDDAVQNSD